jgi:hypothetical protein
MSVWPKTLPANPSLSSSEGALVSVSIQADPRFLESVLEALAQVSFPVNPQIYHDAVVVYQYPGGREETESATLVEFPAYAARVDEVRRALEAYGFDPSNLHVAGMLDAIDTESFPEAPPAGARYLSRFVRKHRAAGAA